MKANGFWNNEDKDDSDRPCFFRFDTVCVSLKNIAIIIPADNVNVELTLKARVMFLPTKLPSNTGVIMKEKPRNKPNLAFAYAKLFLSVYTSLRLALIVVKKAEPDTIPTAP